VKQLGLLTGEGLSKLVRGIVPVESGFAVAEVSPHYVSSLTPSERQMCSSWQEMRRQEFATGRACARSALSLLGAPAENIDRDSRGAPLAPARFRLSISHTRSMAIAVAIRDMHDRRTIGIDIEEEQRICSKLSALVATPQELELARFHRPGGNAAALIFSAKESAFKAAYPRIDRILGFDQVAVDVLSGTSFVARLLIDQPQSHREIAGRFAGEAGVVVTTALMEM